VWGGPLEALWDSWRCPQLLLICLALLICIKASVAERHDRAPASRQENRRDLCFPKSLVDIAPRG
jgi:hypothetical protein